MKTLDASVIVSSFFEQEEKHQQAKKFVDKLRQSGETVIEPEIVLVEVASAIARGTEVSEHALKFSQELRRIPNFIYIPVDEVLSELSVETASYHFLRGADAIYVATAFKYDAGLASFDKDQREKGSELVSIVEV